MPTGFDNCSVVLEREKALLVYVPEVDAEPVWIPKSQIHEDSEVYKEGTEGCLVVTDWFASKRGWI